MVTLKELKKLRTGTMLEIWEELLAMFKSNDYELATRIGLSSGILGNWRSSSKSPKTVRPSTLRMIEKNLGVRIELLPGDHWRIVRDVPQDYDFSLLNEDLGDLIKGLIEDGKNGRLDRIREVRDFFAFLKSKEAK